MPLGNFAGLLCFFLETRIQRNPFDKLSSVTQKKMVAQKQAELLVSRCFDFSAVLCRNWENTTNLIIQVIRASTETAFGNDFKEQYTVYFDFFFKYCVPTIYLDNYCFVPNVLLSFNAIPTCFAKFVVFNEFLNVL